ncbi:hypothetical protein H206_06266 [Candidatus Electrothrix aarhusensis]|uniref:Uncharacterized protein n=1 Tax=Candidatus Electrothrix aarhusensis TaxID=1859131 RepID=A0A3S4TCF4_9BACT|nr:hypothetical protein H206_06266 [Candidatus Electrothrix aarhusensis]
MRRYRSRLPGDFCSRFWGRGRKYESCTSQGSLPSHIIYTRHPGY